MRLCLVNGDMSRRGGTERMTAVLANELCEEHEVYVVSLKPFDGDTFFRLDDRVHIQMLSGHGIPAQIRSLHAFLREKSIDCLINVDIGTAIYGIPAAFGTRTKVVTWEHGNYFNNWGSRWFTYFRRFAAKCSDAIVVLTEKDRENYLSHIHTKKPIYVIPNPVEHHNFQYNTQSKTILSAGLLLPIKGFDQAIEAAVRVLPVHPDWKWIICGDGPERDQLERMIADRGLDEQMFLPGSVSDMDEQYRHAAMYVMTSQMEGLPMVLLEAKSWGLPLVSYDIMTGPSDIIRDGVNGFLVEYGNNGLLASRIGELIADDEKRKAFSEASQIDLDRYDMEMIKRQWIRLFNLL